MIRINDEYSIQADSNCFSAMRRYVAGEDAKEPGKESFAAFAHHSTLSKTLDAIIRRMQRELTQRNDMGLYEAVQAVRELDGHMREWFKVEVEEANSE